MKSLLVVVLFTFVLISFAQIRGSGTAVGSRTEDEPQEQPLPETQTGSGARPVVAIPVEQPEGSGTASASRTVVIPVEQPEGSGTARTYQTTGSGTGSDIAPGTASDQHVDPIQPRATGTAAGTGSSEHLNPVIRASGTGSQFQVQQGSGTGSNLPTEPILPGSGSGTGSASKANAPDCTVFEASISQFLEEVVPLQIGSGSGEGSSSGSGTGTATGSNDYLDMDRLWVPMPADRATDEYRGRAIAFFKQVYGLDFSKNVDGILLAPVEMNRSTKQFVTSAYASQLPAGMTPSSNILVLQDFWMLKLTGTDKGMNGDLKDIQLHKGDFAAYGEFRYQDKSGKDVMPKIIFTTPFPLPLHKVNLHIYNATRGSGTGSDDDKNRDHAAYKWIPVIYNLDSAAFGKGMATGLHLIKESHGIKIRQERIVLTFPSSISELGTKKPSVAAKCVNIST
jgi:hypothetical protein